MMNRTKYWFYHIDDPEIQDKCMYGLRRTDDNLSLYAYTDSKFCAKRFKRERNMNLFRIEILELSSDEIQYMVENHGQQQLIFVSGKTKNRDFTTSDFSIVMSRYESSMVSAESAFIKTTLPSRIREGLEVPKEILLPEYRLLLWKLKYWYFYDTNYHEQMGKLIRSGRGDDSERYTLDEDPEIDFLAVFFKLFIRLMKEG